jgi:hypothetical protein
VPIVNKKICQGPRHSEFLDGQTQQRSRGIPIKRGLVRARFAGKLYSSLMAGKEQRSAAEVNARS